MSSERINETEQHELDVIDAIVRGGGEARPEDAALTDFALLVRNARPVPNHGEAAALDARVQAPASARERKQRLIFKPAFAGFCALVLLVGAFGAAYIGSLDGTTALTSDGGDDAAPASAQPESTDDFAAAEKSALPSESGITSAEAPREVARQTRVVLAADGSDIERLSDRVNAIVDRYDGYVASSRVRGGEGNRGRATFALMIPATQYKPALASISKLAHVRSRSQSSEDITTAVNSADRELDRWTARVNRLENQLAAAETPAQQASLRRQLASANAARRAAARQVRANRARVNYVPIALTIVADKTAENKDKGEIAKAFDKAGTILTGIAAVLIVVLAVLIPLALIASAIWFGLRRFNRARADRAIESATTPQPE
jgi:hypothetical protein